MPIYEYRCEQGHQFEVTQRMADDPVSACETCAAPVARVFHPIAIHFKGSGFYSTDYGSRKRSRELKEAAEGNGKHAGDDSSGSSKSDSKSEAASKSENSNSNSKSESASKSETSSASTQKSESTSSSD